jgi:hypothetical protein
VIGVSFRKECGVTSGHALSNDRDFVQRLRALGEVSNLPIDKKFGRLWICALRVKLICSNRGNVLSAKSSLSSIYTGHIALFNVISDGKKFILNFLRLQTIYIWGVCVNRL